MSDLLEPVSNLHLKEWFVVSIPFLLIAMAAMWLLTPAGDRWMERMMHGPLRRAALAAGRIGKPVSKASQAAARVWAPAQYPTPFIPDAPEPSAVSISS